MKWSFFREVIGETAFLPCAEALYHLFRARWYNPTNGRFTSVDPYSGDKQSPASLHKYLYAKSSPISYSDPSGKFCLGEEIAAMEVSNILSINAMPTLGISTNVRVIALSLNVLEWRGDFSQEGYLNLLVEFKLTIQGNKNKCRIAQDVAGKETEGGETTLYPEWTSDGGGDWWDGENWTMGAGDLNGAGHQPYWNGANATWYDAPGFHSPGISSSYFPVRYVGINGGNFKFKTKVLDNSKNILRELNWEIYINYESPNEGDHYFDF